MKEEALDLALEALILKTGMNPVMQGSCYVMHPEALQAVIDEAIKQALAAPVQNPITEEMHIAAVKVLHRANGVDGLPQRMLDAMLAAQLAQPAPVQEPVGCEGAIVNGRVYADRLEHDYKFECEAGPLHLCNDWIEFCRCFEWLATHTTPPAAQPVIPDAMTSADIQEHIEYVAGWNDCRQAMMEMMK